MAEIVTEGQRAVPERALEPGTRFAHPDLDEALRVTPAALARRVGRVGCRADASAATRESGLAGTISQMITPTTLRSSPVPRPGFSP